MQSKHTNKGKTEIKTGRIETACERYDLGKNTMRKVAEDAGAVIHIGKCLLINFEIMDAYMMKLSEVSSQEACTLSCTQAE